MYGSYGSSGSYGSYSSMGASTPLDIPTSSYLYSPSSNSSCAFPSWPRRSSLSESDSEMRATSFLSDDDLLDVFEDDASSIASGGSSAVCSPLEHAPLSDEQILELQRERLAMQREVAKFILDEKERRRQAAKEKKARRGSSKKSPKAKVGGMTPIAEAGE